MLPLADIGRGKDARPPGHDDRQVRRGQAFEQQPLETLRIGVGVDDGHAADADGARDPLDRELVRRAVVKRTAGARVLLLAGHRRSAVVEHEHDVAGGRRVVGHLDKAADARVDERGVADHRNDAPGFTLG